MRPGIQTTEFWLTLAVIVAKYFVPDLPEETIYAVIAYVIARAGVKATAKA